MSELNPYLLSLLIVLAIYLLWRTYRRLQLSVAKHPSLTGHSKMSRRLSKRVPAYSLSKEEAFICDGAPEGVCANRRTAFEQLSGKLRRLSVGSMDMSHQLESGVSDLNFTSRYRVPYQFSEVVKAQIPDQLFVDESEGVRIKDVDGHWYYDVGGSYGVNLFGYDFYKSCIQEGMRTAGDLGPVLGPYHPVVVDNVRRLRAISGLEEVSFHMSGTEAVMQAVRLARYQTGRKKIVTFCGAYHGWWDDVQPGVGNPVGTANTLMLRDMDDRALRVLRTRRDVACVLVNPLQALHPNKSAPGDGTLLSNGRSAGYDKAAYAQWLKKLRAVCNLKGIALIMDEVFLGFRLAPGGAQEYFDVRADLVTYGKTLGGGLPVGVLCGSNQWMQRFKPDQPANICFARGTFNAHPLVMASMNAFLWRLDSPEIRAMQQNVDAVWDGRAARMNVRLKEEGLPLSIAHMASVWTFVYDVPSRYNWMLQFYLRAEGLALSWVGSGRFIFSHNYDETDFEVVCERVVAAAKAMEAGGWWWVSEEGPSVTKQLLREMLGARRSARRPQEPMGEVSSARGS